MTPAQVLARGDLTITTTHRTALRLLPTTLEFLARQQLAHVVPQLIDAGLVDCRAGLYGLTPGGRGLLAAHERARTHAAMRRWLDRAAGTLDALRGLEASMRDQHDHGAGHAHTWTVRGAEVQVRTAHEQLWSAMCMVNAHVGDAPLAATMAREVPA